jgi:hypothetical protein
MRVAIAFVFLYAADLAMMHRAIDRIAAGRGIRGRKCFSQRRYARHQNRKQCGDSQNFPSKVPDFHDVLGSRILS